MIRVQLARLGQRLLWPNNLANLRKYAVQCIGATKPPAPESPRTASLKLTLVLCLATVYCTAVLCCCASFEGVTTFDSYRACV